MDLPLAPEAEIAVTDEKQAGALGRLGRWLPRLSGLAQFANRTGIVSAISAGVIWWAVVRPDLLFASGAAGAIALGVPLAFLGVLLIPAASAWLLGLTLKDILALPETLRAGAAAVAEESRGALKAAKSGGRITGVIRAVWAARGFVLASKGMWGRAATAARVARLARLPFVLGTLLMFALNAPVIIGGIVALVTLLV